MEWFNETLYPNIGQRFQVTKIVFREKTEHQDLVIFETPVLGRVLANERLARGAMRIIDGGGWRKEKFVRWMFEDEPRAAIFTPRRWHRGFLKRPGVALGSSK